MSFWRKSNGKLVGNSQGRLINCDHCPCDEQPMPCDNWLTELSGQPILYNISIAMTASSYTKWHQVYSEYEEEDYEGEESLMMTATISNVPASSVIGRSLSFQVNSVNGFDSSRYDYEYHDEEYGERWFQITENTNSLSSIIGGGCPTDDPENELTDDMLHGWTFECNNNEGKLRIDISPSVGTCHGTYTEYYKSDWGEDTFTDQRPVNVGVVTIHLTRPNVNCSVENYQGLGYILRSSSTNLSYESGDPSDDYYRTESYAHTITFTPIIPGD